MTGIRKISLLLFGSIAFISVLAFAGSGTLAAFHGPPDPNEDRAGSSISNPESKSPLQVSPSNVQTEVEIDTNMEYTIYEKVGDSINYRPPEQMSYQDFAEYQRVRMMREYWENIQARENPDGDNDAEEYLIKIAPPGVPPVEIRPSGNVVVDFGWQWQRTENPAVPVRNQRTGGFNFDQQISLNLAGTVGDRLKINANWDTEAQFSYDNNIKIEYASKETDIIRSVEVGDITMPLNNTLIRGSNNLFGIKTVMQFGRLGVTALVSNRRSSTQTMVIRGGAQSREFDIRSSNYDEAKHFFLAHYFRDVFEQAYQNNPTSPNNGFKITRVEAYITNSNTQTENLRNILALADLGEARRLNNPNAITSTNPNAVPSNGANNLYSDLMGDQAFRDPDQTVSELQGRGLRLGTDFEKINSARLLEAERDYNFHADLGYLSLNRRLQDDEALAIAFEFTINGQTYKVGEMQEEIANIGSDSVIVLKMLKPQSIKTETTTWDLMMKNVYALNTSGVQRDNFRCKIIYRDDRTGIDNPSLQEGAQTTDVPLVQLMELDKIDLNGNFVSDGNFDFIENATILTERGKIVFPVLEPFGSHLRDQFNVQTEGEFINKYVYQSLYEDPLSLAEQVVSKDKFWIQGQYQSATSQNIRLNGFRITPGSVTIQVGSNMLTEDIDYTVNYTSGTVRITNTGVLASGNDIRITYEQEDIANFRTKSLLGARFDYTLSDDINLGATFLYLTEQAYVSRVNLGSEPLKNIQFGLDAKYKGESRFITKMVDFLPVIQTKEKSTVALDWEGAALIPGSSRLVGEGGVGYLDDFEGAERPIQLANTPTLWKLGSTPRTLEDAELKTTYTDWLSDSLQYAFHRAKMAWYTIDRTYYFPSFNDVGFDNLSDSATSINNYTRMVRPQEIFEGLSVNITQTNQSTFDIAYFPKERGQFNYNINTAEVDENGLFREPRKNWGAMMRALENRTDFNETNVEYIEFWMMDPFGNTDDLVDALPPEYRPGSEYGPEHVYNPDRAGGTIYFHLGDISEDVIKDGRHGFENGLANEENTELTKWGRVTTEQYITDAFDNAQDRSQQDVGMDGLDDEEEQIFFNDYREQVQNSGFFNLNARNVREFLEDPSTDNFVFHNLGGDDDRIVINRYMDYNNTENNSPENTGDQNFTQSSTTRPDNEDLNDDHTLNITDDYFQYKMELDPNNLASSEYINDVVQGEQGIRWYQVRIPIRKNLQSHAVGNITSLQTVKFVRVVLTDFEQPIILRTTEMQLVGSQWRRWGRAVNDQDVDVLQEESRNFVVSTVNIEENSSATSDDGAPYVVPPGSIRDLDRSTGLTNVLQNESSLQLSVESLRDGFSELAFKNGTYDVLNYRKLEMYIHAETLDMNTEDGDMTAFLRIGTDQMSDYYEVEIPLMFTDLGGALTDNEIWMDENFIDLELAELINVKVARDRDPEADYNRKYVMQVGKYNIGVKGRPDLSSIQSMVLGIRNPDDDSDEPESATVWFNELRVTDYNTQMGMASRGSLTAQLADLGSVTATGQVSTAGWGGIETSIGDLQRETRLQYGVQTNLAMDKFIPGKTGIKLPLYASYNQTIVRPQYDPLDPDVNIQKSIDSQPDSTRNEYAEKVIYKQTVRSINLTNVKKEKTNPKAKNHFYDVSNVSLSAGYSDDRRGGLGGDNSTIGNGLASYIAQTYTGSAAYAYSFKPLSFEPFKKVKFFNKKYLRPIKEINVNFMPSSVSFNGNLNRFYERTLLYNSYLTTEGSTPLYTKRFTFDRNYTLRWSLTKSININYTAQANALIDEPLGNRLGDDNISQEEYRDSVIKNLLSFGRIANYTQNINATYKVPIDKFPLLDWTRADVGYKMGYVWNAGPVGYEDVDGVPLGNVVTNSRDMNVNAKADFTRLYNKSDYLKKINNPPRSRRRRTKEKPDPEADTVKTKVQDTKVVKSLLRMMMMTRDVSGRYTISHQTAIPGFMPSPQYLGANFDDDGFAPGVPFLLGDQNLQAFKSSAVDNDWLTRSSYQNDPLIQNMKHNLSLKATLEPVSSFRINLDAKYTTNTSYNEIFRIDTATNQYGLIDSWVSGNTQMSYINIRTFFDDVNDDNVSQNFENFESYRNTIRDRLVAQSDTLTSSDYGSYHQDVLIPAFLAAYTGVDPNQISLSKTPRVPLPNWKITYSGLSKVKLFQKRFRTISLTHSYDSDIKIPSYTSSAQYDNFYTDQFTFGNLNRSLNDPYAISSDSSSTIVPYYLVSEIAITERFNPLIGVNIKTRKNVSYNFSYNKSRTLSLVNNQLNELNSKEFKFSFSYTRKNTPVPFTKAFTPDGTRYVLENDITFKLNVSVKDTKEDQRLLDGTQKVTGGNYNLRIQPNITYQYSKKLRMQLYYDHNLNEPKISTSFPRSTTALGFRLTYSL